MFVNLPPAEPSGCSGLWTKLSLVSLNSTLLCFPLLYSIFYFSNFSPAFMSSQAFFTSKIFILYLLYSFDALHNYFILFYSFLLTPQDLFVYFSFLCYFMLFHYHSLFLYLFLITSILQFMYVYIYFYFHTFFSSQLPVPLRSDPEAKNVFCRSDATVVLFRLIHNLLTLLYSPRVHLV